MTPTDPDPTAAERARCVAWLRAFAARHEDRYENPEEEDDDNIVNYYGSAAHALRKAAAALERGERP